MPTPLMKDAILNLVWYSVRMPQFYFSTHLYSTRTIVAHDGKATESEQVCTQLSASLFAKTLYYGTFSSELPVPQAF